MENTLFNIWFKSTWERKQSSLGATMSSLKTGKANIFVLVHSWIRRMLHVIALPVIHHMPLPCVRYSIRHLKKINHV